jgi:hypothetical protein
MSDVEIDHLIETLESDFTASVNGLLAAGEPALVRLLGLLSGRVAIPALKYSFDAWEYQRAALARLASAWPEAVQSLLEQGKIKMTLGIILGLGASDDLQLQHIAKEALRTGDF